MGFTTVNQRGPIRGSCLLSCPVISGHLKVVLCKLDWYPKIDLDWYPKGLIHCCYNKTVLRQD